MLANVLEVDDSDVVVLGVDDDDDDDDDDDGDDDDDDDDDDEDEDDIGDVTDVGKSVVIFLRFFSVLGNCMAYAVSSIGPVKRRNRSACAPFVLGNSFARLKRHNDSTATLTSVSNIA